MIKFTAEELKNWTDGKWNLPTDNLNISDLSIDSRKFCKGDLYIEIKGENFDGHSFIDKVIDNGASAVIAEHISTDKVPTLLVKNTRKALGAFAAGYRQKLNIPIIGITGSSGKTTVKEMTAAIFETTYNTCSTKENLNNEIGLPLSLLSLNENHQFGVFEIGSNHPGEIGYLADIMQPNIAIITNSGTAHIGNFGSEDAIAAEKGDILKNLSSDGVAILNKDNKFFEYHKKLCRCRIISVSLNAKADIQLKHIKGSRITINLNNTQAMTYNLPLPGKHNITNSMQAVAAALLQNIPTENMIRALENFKIYGMRWQRIQKNNILYVNDAYNANPDSMCSAIETFAAKYPQESSALILGGMLELGNDSEKEHIRLGNFVSGFNWGKIILVGKYNSLIHKGIIDNGFNNNKILVCDNNREVIAFINDRGLKGCSQVLLKASRGFKLEEILEGIK